MSRISLGTAAILSLLLASCMLRKTPSHSDASSREGLAPWVEQCGQVDRLPYLNHAGQLGGIAEVGITFGLVKSRCFTVLAH